MLVRRFGAQVLVSMLASGSSPGCKRDGESDPPASTREADESDDPDPNPTDEGSELETIGHDAADYVGRELPVALTGELHDPAGRIVVLAPSFVAASACTDCGAPSYLWFLAVRCKAEADCEVLTEACAGRIVVGGSGEFTLAFVANEGIDPNACADYSGAFLRRDAQ